MAQSRSSTFIRSDEHKLPFSEEAQTVDHIEAVLHVRQKTVECEEQTRSIILIASNEPKSFNMEAKWATA
ncbi:hypothetical protein DWB67_10010 [Paracoccus sp. JM45]|nr:hypothetical protein DWB67_10010 [Paracoccus sp. JM45]